MLGDAYGAAVVEALSKKELEAMDLEMKKQLERERSDLESAQTDLKTKKVSNQFLQNLRIFFYEFLHYRMKKRCRRMGAIAGLPMGPLLRFLR